MPRPRHPDDLVVEQVLEDLITEPAQIAEALRYRGMDPFGARSFGAKESEIEDYWREQFFSPDGSPNQQGRDKAMKVLSQEQFIETLASLNGKADREAELSEAPIGGEYPG